MHALGLREGALELYAIGMTPGWIARELGVPRRTVGHWLNRPRPARRLESARPLPQEPYSYLLGLYLGDGHIATAHMVRAS